MSEKLISEQETRLRQLLEAFLSGELRAEDRDELTRGLDSPEGEELIKNIMERRVEEEPVSGGLEVKAALDQWLDERVVAPTPALAPVRTMRNWWWGVAAAVLIGIVGGIFCCGRVRRRAWWRGGIRTIWFRDGIRRC
ncbi:hypothetical protein ACQ86N_27810 [Puia sp. P3]|uniref:hypothetical protein n=1 Tax=Puia sp. P3 TaxID=3423952 RepID=UPI003D66500E